MAAVRNLADWVIGMEMKMVVESVEVEGRVRGAGLAALGPGRAVEAAGVMSAMGVWGVAEQEATEETARRRC